MDIQTQKTIEKAPESPSKQLSPDPKALGKVAPKVAEKAPEAPETPVTK